MKAIVFIAAFVLVFLSGCTTLVKDCEQQGQSQYFHCKRIFMPK